MLRNKLGRAVDNKLLAVLVCALAFFAGIGLMRWIRKRTEKGTK
jgi:hypothetical protein